MQLGGSPSAALGRLASCKPRRPSILNSRTQHYAATELRYLTCPKSCAGACATTAGYTNTPSGGRTPASAGAAGSAVSGLCPVRTAPPSACRRVLLASLPCRPPPVAARVISQIRSAALPPPQSAAPAAAGASAPPEIDLERIFPGGEYSVEMQVRDNELDQFSVVNNAVYCSFFQHARHEAFAALGYEVDEYARGGTPLALSQLNIKFHAPLRSRDVFRVSVWVQKVTGVRVVFQQRITKRSRLQQQREQGQRRTAAEEQEELIAEAEAVVVFLDAHYRPSRIPREAGRRFHQLADMRTAAAAAVAR